MRNFKQNQHKLSNNHVQFSSRNLPYKFDLPSKKSWIRPFILFYLHGPAHMGPIWNPVALPIWVPYRLLAGFPGGGGGVRGVLSFFGIRRLGPSIYRSTKKYQEFQARQKIFEILATPKNIRYSIPCPSENTLKCIEMTLSIVQFLWLPPKIIHKTSIPQKYIFFWKPPKILKFKILNMTRAYVCMKISEYHPPRSSLHYQSILHRGGGGGGGTTRGHSLKLFKRRSRLKIRSNSFRNRVVDTWNSLQEQIVQAPSLNCFKSRLNNWGQHFPGSNFFQGVGSSCPP